MKWGAPTIVHYVEHAGFPRSLWAGMTALALATSGGHDNYDVRAGSPGSGHWIGLWGVNVDRWPDLADVDLTDPQANARAAYRLCARTGGITWCPAGETKQWVAYHAHATSQLSYAPFTETVHEPVAVVTHQTLGTVDHAHRRQIVHG